MDALERLLSTLDVRLEAFAICEIEAGWRLTSSPMEGDVLHYVLKGEGVLEAHGERIPIGADTIVVAPARAEKSIAGPGAVLHEASASENCVLLSEGVVAIRALESRADLVIACGAVSATYGGCYGLFEHLTEPLVARSSSLSPMFAHMLDELSTPRLGARVVAEALMKQSLVLLLRDQMDQLGARSPLFGPLVDARLARAVAAVIAEPARPHTVNSLAGAAGMSRSTFAVRFLKSYGRSPMDFVQAVRLRTAARLLRTSELPVKTVAAAVGYSSRSHFSRAFSNLYGVDPSRYRHTPQAVAGEAGEQPLILTGGRGAGGSGEQADSTEGDPINLAERRDRAAAHRGPRRESSSDRREG
jgi:AraC-like DNA-binding protein